MKKSIITGTASVNVLLNDGNSILKEVDFVGKFNERKNFKQNNLHRYRSSNSNSYNSISSKKNQKIVDEK